MHFLCLHGLGTNSHVLEMQTAPIRYEMDRHHTYEFVEGCAPASIASEIRGFYPSQDEYFNYWNDSIESVFQSLSQLQTYIDEEGPFDGVLAFSQGVQLVSTYLINLRRQRPGCILPFKCAIFFSGTTPIDVGSPDSGHIELVDLSTSGMVIDLPTGHIWGSNDIKYGNEAKALTELYDKNLREVYVHSGGHEIPGARAKDDIQQCVRVIRRTIEKASVER